MVASPTAPETLRLHQANERTLLAWIRTGIALMAFGFALVRVDVLVELASGAPSRSAARAGGSLPLGIALVVVGTSVNGLATLRFARVRRAIERGDVGGPPALMVYAFGAVAVALGVLVALLLAGALD